MIFFLLSLSLWFCARVTADDKNPFSAFMRWIILMKFYVNKVTEHSETESEKKLFMKSFNAFMTHVKGIEKSLMACVRGCRLKWKSFQVIFKRRKKIFFTFKEIRNGTSVISSMASGKMLDACSSQVANILSTALNCILSSSFFKDVLQNIIRVEI